MGKRLIKSPKVYFYDNGILSYLLNINSLEQYEKGILYGAMFENYVISEVQKRKFNQNILQNLFFFRSSNGEEIDLVIEEGLQSVFYEIKASVTYKPAFHKAFSKLKLDNSECGVIYQGKSEKIYENLNAWNYMEFLTKS
jgi:hypothetical protein